jgi:hypothetical protein
MTVMAVSDPKLDETLPARKAGERCGSTMSKISCLPPEGIFAEVSAMIGVE